MTTNSAATPGHWGQPVAFLHSQDGEEREVGDRQWKSRHPSQLRRRDECCAPAADRHGTSLVFHSCFTLVHSPSRLRLSFVFHSFHWFHSCFILARARSGSHTGLGENLRHGRGKEGKERGNLKRGGGEPGLQLGYRRRGVFFLLNMRIPGAALATGAFYSGKLAGSSSSKSMSFSPFFFLVFYFSSFVFSMFLCFSLFDGFFFFFFALFHSFSFFLLFSTSFFLPLSFSVFFFNIFFFSFFVWLSFSFSQFILFPSFLFSFYLCFSFCIPL